MVRRIDYMSGGFEQSDSAWIYDTAQYGLGKLHFEDQMMGTTTPIQRIFDYDVHGRASSALIQPTPVRI